MMNGANGGGVQGSSWRRRVHSFLPTTAGNPRAQGACVIRCFIWSIAAQCIRIRHSAFGATLSMQLQLSVLQVTRVAVDGGGR
jgi:hypothetical protein